MYNLSLFRHPPYPAANYEWKRRRQLVAPPGKTIHSMQYTN